MESAGFHSVIRSWKVDTREGCGRKGQGSIQAKTHLSGNKPQKKVREVVTNIAEIKKKT